MNTQTKAVEAARIADRLRHQMLEGDVLDHVWKHLAGQAPLMAAIGSKPPATDFDPITLDQLISELQAIRAAAEAVKTVGERYTAEFRKMSEK